MGKTLLSAVLKFTSRILLLVMLTSIAELVEAQSLLLPGDVTIVTVNSSTNSFDIIPLVDIDPGTDLYVSNSLLKRSKNGLQAHNNGVITFNTRVSAGTNLTISSQTVPDISWEGNLKLSLESDSLYIYQQEEDIQRFIFGVSWGEMQNENTLPILPEMLNPSQNTWVRLGTGINHQYHLKNGASGTTKMLLQMVGDPANWRASNDAFNSLGTSFRVLSAPVVIFDENINTVTEGDSIILNVAIYGHDGSRLSVDVDFISTYSTADTSDVSLFEKQTINFTGLIGNAVYAIIVPTADDDSFEGNETAFFELSNLTKGQFGDFINHVTFIRENDEPKVSISEIMFSNNEETDFIEIQNEEDAYLDISGWSITGHQFTYPLPDQLEIEPFGRRRITFPKTEGENRVEGNWITARSGTILLINGQGTMLASQSYKMGEVLAKIERPNNTREMEVRPEIGIKETELPQLSESSTLSLSVEGPSDLKTKVDSDVQKPNVAGWFITNTHAMEEIAENKPLFFWNEKVAAFTRFNATKGDSLETGSLFYFVETQEVEQPPKVAFEDTLNQAIPSQEGNTEFAITISATDVDENGSINDAEGFNFFTNFLEDSIPVGAFIHKLETELGEGVIRPQLMLWPENGTGWMGVELLTANEVIPPKRSFWVKIDSVVSATNLLLRSEILSVTTVESPEIYTEPEAHIQLHLMGELGERDVEINWFKVGEALPVSTLVPSLLKELSITSNAYLEFGGYDGTNWNSALNISGSEDIRLVVPLAISSSNSEPLTLSVKGWESAPGWRIFLEDVESGEAQELDLNAQVIIEFSVQSSIQSANENDRAIIYGDISKNVDTRYQVVLYPPGVEVQELESPTGFELFQNYPNPFNPATTISFYLPETAQVKLQVFNVVGQPITTLENGVLNTGDHQYEWNATGFPSGMYIYQLEVGTNIMTRKMTLVK